MRLVRPRHCVRPGEIVGRALADLAARACDEVVDPLVRRVLEVVLVAAEHRPDAAAGEQRHQPLHAVGVVMPRSRAERRMVAEGQPPPDAGRRLERLLDPFPVLGILEQAFAAEEAFLRRVEADELDVASVPEPVEQSRVDRGAP